MIKKYSKPILITLVILFIIAGGVGYYFSNVILTSNNAVAYAEIPEKQTLMASYKELTKEMNGERIQLKSQHGYDLVGYFFPAKEKTTRTIISAHGYTNSKADMQKFIPMFHELGFNVMTFDHRNSGESGGDYTTYGLIESEDLKTVVDYTKERFGEDSMLGIHGVSMGAATTLLYGGMIEDRADFYIADCSYSNFKKEAEYRLAEDFPSIPSIFHKPIVTLGDTVLKMRAGYSINDASPIKYVQNIKKPVLFINTKTDDYIPPYMTDELYAAKKGPKSIYLTETGAHAKAYDVDPKQYKAEIITFLKMNFN